MAEFTEHLFLQLLTTKTNNVLITLFGGKKSVEKDEN